MGSSKTDYIFVLIIFYLALGFFLSAWGSDYEESEVSVLGVDINIGIVGAVANMPIWVTSLLTAIGIFAGWLILSSILPSAS